LPWVSISHARTRLQTSPLPSGGKSAVLVGLALALGASTRFTNRGKKQDQFINRETNASYDTIYGPCS